MGDAGEPSDLEKLKRLLPYLHKHTEEHLHEMQEWIDKIKGTDEDGVTGELRRVVALSEEICGHLQTAIGKLAGRD